MTSEISCFRRSNFPTRIFSSSTERGEQVKCAVPRVQTLLLAPRLSLLTPFLLISVPRRCRRAMPSQSDNGAGTTTIRATPRRTANGGGARGGVMSSGVANNAKTDAAVFRILFSLPVHRPRRLPSFLPVCLATHLFQRSSFVLARKP